MFQPYSNYIAALESPGDDSTLNECIDLAHMLVVGHRHPFSSEQTVRKSVQSLRIGLPMKNAVGLTAEG